nr:unnamed protein product [Spirometra erinaceieuropaei]
MRSSDDFLEFCDACWDLSLLGVVSTLYTTTATSSSSSSTTFSIVSTSAALPSVMPVNTKHNPDTPKNTNTAIDDTKDEDLDCTCPHCDRTFISRIVLVDHLRIHRTETGEPMSEAPTNTHRTRLHCPH